MTTEQLASSYTLFSRLRWVGIASFALAAPLFVISVAALLVGRGGWGLVLPGVAALGLSLGAFGSANDSAIYAARELGLRGAAPPAAAAEVAVEAARRPARLAKAHASPKTAFAVPVLVLLLHGYLWPRVLAAWG